MPRTTDTLSPKEQRFIDAHLDPSLSAKECAVRAGYSPRSATKTAHGLLQKPRIRTEIAKARRAQQERTLISADKVLLDIQNMGDKALKGGEFTAAIRSRELIGKHYKLFTDKHELTGSNGSPLLFANVTDEQLDARIKALQAKVDALKG